MAAAEDARYSIRLVSRMSGISSHTLRMWERRYGFPQPERTSGGARRYTEEDVEQLKLVARALELGYRPNEVVGKGRESLRKIVAEQEAIPTPGGDLPDVERAVERVIGDEIEGFGVEVRRAVAVLGPKKFVTEFAAPFVSRVGELWEEDKLTVGQEHVATEVMTTELRVLLRAYDTLRGRPRVILATLPDEHHVLGLSLVALYLAVSGAEPRLVGGQTPIEEVADVASRTEADVVGLSLSSSGNERASLTAVRSLVSLLPPRTKLWLGGAGAEPLAQDLPEGVQVVTTWTEIDKALSRWRSGA